MIENALIFLRNQINSYLKLRLGITNDMAVIDNIVSQNGVLNASELCLSLINVEEEKIHKSQSPYKIADNGTVNLVNPEIKLNLYVLFTANFGTNNYGEALRFLSHVITFFQGRQVFHRQNAPALDEQIEKLIIELVTLSFEQQNHLWGFIGAKYIPSVLYKVRLLTVADEAALREMQILSDMNINFSQ